MTDCINAKQLIEAGLSRSFAHHVVAETRKVGLPLAIWLNDEHGLKVGPLVGKTRREIDVLRATHGSEPPASVRRRVASRPSPEHREVA